MHRPVEWKRAFNNKSKQIKSTNFLQGHQEDEMGKRIVSSINDVGKLYFHMQKNKIGLLPHTIHHAQKQLQKDKIHN